MLLTSNGLGNSIKYLFQTQMPLHVRITFFLLLSSMLFVKSFGLVEGKLGKLDASATINTTYDSRVFMLPSNEFKAIKNSGGKSGVPTNEMKSEDDLILTFSPALHYTTKVGLLKISGSAGLSISHFFLNDDKSYLAPTTSISIDFDDTMALKKRISNNAKIRFESTFDVGQSIGASVLEQDLISFTYITAGFRVRYNHSKKFGVGGGTSYSYRFYQSANSRGADRPNLDFSTLPLNFDAYYIYSEKLDFFTSYGFTKSKAHDTNTINLTDANNHSISIGADGVYSPKFSGTASIGYSLIDYLNSGQPNQDNLITSISIAWKHNSKTSTNYSLSRAFAPTAQGFSTFSTTFRAGLAHRFTERLSGNAYLSASKTTYTYANDYTLSAQDVKESSSMNTYGFGFSLARPINETFTASTGYDFSLMDKGLGSYNRHLINAQVTGRF